MMKRVLAVFGIICFAAPVAWSLPLTMTAALARLPLSFVENEGQFAGPARFVGCVPGAVVEFHPGAVTFVVRRRAIDESGAAEAPPAPGTERRPADGTGESIEILATFVGANPSAAIRGERVQPGTSSYYFGDDPSRWRTGLANYEAVRYHGLYPGVDLEYHGNERRLEYDFHVSPGADPRQIRVRYRGIEKLAVTADGKLSVTTRFGAMTEDAPVAYQTIGNERRPVEVGYRLLSPDTFGFSIDGNYDRTAPLVIDPVLNYSTFLGGGAGEEAHEIACNAAGEAWVIGSTQSPNFPASGSPVPVLNSVVFVSRLSPNGSSLVYSVFLGGSDDQLGFGLDLDASGNAYISGTTGSSNFPTTAGAYSNSYSGSSSFYTDLFMAKLSPTGALLYSTFLGGTGVDVNSRLALGPGGRVYLFGDTESTDYPTTAGAYDLTFNGQSDFLLSVLNPAGAGAADLVYSTYIGGNDFEEGHGDLTVDATGDAYFCSATRSSNFPAGGGPPYNGTFDAVVAKVRPAGAGAADLLFATKLGGSGDDYGAGVAIDASLNVFADGITPSLNFPTIGTAYQPFYGGGGFDGFVTKLAPNGTTMVYSTFIGGSGTDMCAELALDPAGNAVAIGSTDSPNFPTSSGAFDPSFNGGTDTFISSFDATGSLLTQSTYFGGTNYDLPYGFKIDPSDHWYVAGTTQSTDHPVTGSAYDTGFNGGGSDAFVAKFTPQISDSCALCASPADTCCEKAPHIFEAPAFSPHILVGTREPDPGNAWPYCVTIFDLGSPTPTEDVDWSTVIRFNGPGNSWNADSLGSVFGLTLDEYGNIFVTHASCYISDLLGQVAGGGPGAVYRIDGGTGTITTFCRLPNYPDPNVTAGLNLPALGNITYDCRHKQFFVTDLEDGRIYRITPNGVNAPTGSVVDTFDPGVLDLGPTNYLTPINLVPSPGWAPLGERLWGVQVHGDRVYYAVWAEDGGSYSAAVANEIRSVGLAPNGSFIPSSDKHELFTPSLPSQDLSFPVSDISFDANGRMLLAERGIENETIPLAHLSRVLEYACVAGCWQPANTFAVGDGVNKLNSTGGVDYDRFAYSGGPIGRIWASGDALHFGGSYPDFIYGYQGFRPTGGTNVTSLLIDSDGVTNAGGRDKTNMGDVEAPGCPNTGAGEVCGIKFLDFNRNGVKDGGEPPLQGWTIVLSGTGGTYTAVTDALGRYCFEDVPPGTYTLSEVGVAGWIQTAPAGGTYSIILVAGQSILGKDFGNYSVGPNNGCVMPPPGMGAWWPFNETTGSTTAADVTHPNPVRNTAQLFGGAAYTTSGMVGNALCFGSTADYARVLNAAQLGINFGAGSYAMDVWVNVSSGATGPRMIAEKRVLVSSSPYRTLGWALYLNGLQSFLEIGIGVNTQVFPGPTVTAGTWNHLAVSVDRPAVQGRWYLNGAPAPAFNFTPLVGSVSSSADLYMGRVSPSFGSGAPFEGCIDELELFNTPLSAQSVAQIAASGVAGKCPEYCRVPQVASICRNNASVTVCFNICNNGTSAQSYHWSLAGLPAGAGCSVNGPTVFNPPAGAVTVPAGSCSAPICVTIQRPPGMTAQNATACYAFSFVNDASGVGNTCTGTIRADNTCWCVTPVQTGIVTVGRTFAPGTIGVPIVIGVGHPCDIAEVLNYQLTAVYEPGAHPDPLDVSLNGLPPGEPVFGTLSLGPNESGEIEVEVSYPHDYDPAGLYEILLEADTDGDGVMEPVCATRLASMYEEDVSSVPIDGGAPEVPRLATSPNPFLKSTTISFHLPAAGNADLSLYDLSGRLVRALRLGSVEAGTHSVTWDGRDDNGRDAAGGIYFVRLRAAGAQVQAKIVKLR